MDIVDNLHKGIVFIVLFFFAICIPLGLTIWNIINLFKGSHTSRAVACVLTVVIGGFMYLVLLGLFDINGEWYEPIYSFQHHTPISGEYGWTFVLTVLFGFVGLLTLFFGKPEKMPPLITVLSTASVILLNIESALFGLQLIKPTFMLALLLFYVYHFNILILSVNAVRRNIRAQSDYLSTREEDFGHKKNIFWLFMKVKKISQYSVLIMTALFLLVAIMEIIAVLIGQGLDAPIKAFTDTADWTFSQQIPPPPKEYEGHYLCTVAAGGHRKVVKPIRFGRRRGAVIVVNRQLCIANAFEESIAEKFPRFHKWIRHIYDTYGYPLSNIITTKARADVTYILMKPLEWIFLIYLYLTDSRPEIRINRQYRL